MELLVASFPPKSNVEVAENRTKQKVSARTKKIFMGHFSVLSPD